MTTFRPSADVCLRPLAGCSPMSFSAMRLDAIARPTAAFADHQIVCPPTIQRSVASRRTSFLAGRLCAREVVRSFRIGFDAEIPIGIAGEPVFPDGLVGSISHGAGHAVAVCREAEAGHLGVDVETILSADVIGRIGDHIADREEVTISDWGSLPCNVRYSLVFSAKEAAFKATYPELQCISDFRSARVVSVDPGGSILLQPSSGVLATSDAISVRFRVGQANVLTIAERPVPLLSDSSSEGV